MVDSAASAVEPGAQASPPAPPYAGLTPEVVLNAVDAAGWRTTGTLLQLNSYENRVFMLGVEDAAGADGFVVAKFYRPARWTDAQIREEHAFAAELAAAEIPAVPPLAVDGETLFFTPGFRFSVFPGRGGRAPNLDQPEVLQWIGRFLGRIHAVSATRPFAVRPTLDAASFGEEPLAYLLAHDHVPAESRATYAGVVRQALDAVARCYARAGEPRLIRTHGDVHEGNVLWTDSPPLPGPHFVDLDDARMAPAVQDLWMLLGHERAEQSARLADLLAGYEDFADFDRHELHLVEALRTLRLIHYSAWIARRWQDPAFPAAFPWFATPRYWEARILELREQVAAMDEPPLVA